MKFNSEKSEYTPPYEGELELGSLWKSDVNTNDSIYMLVSSDPDKYNLINVCPDAGHEQGRRYMSNKENKKELIERGFSPFYGEIKIEQTK